MENKNQELLGLASRGILARLGRPVRGPVHILCAESKSALGEALAVAAQAQRLGADLALLSCTPRGAGELIRATQTGSLVILADPPQAPWLFEIVGRPDRGLLLPREHLYCDWLMPYEALLRILAVDYGQVQGWRARLLSALYGATHLHLETPSGTDLTLTPRKWQTEDGEVYTAPQEASVHGELVIDGALYDGPPAKPILLRIVAGRVADLEMLAQADPRQRMLYADLTRDEGASLVAELGLGINPGARPDASIMEAEMALGACHVGLGHNLPYGGANASGTHVDLGLLRPTITVGERVICREGEFLI